MRIALFLLALVQGTALAALPPRSTENLAETADVVAVGRVAEVTSKSEAVGPGSSNLNYVITVDVLAVQKGEAIKPDAQARFTARKTEKRPMGWAGPQGQNVVPAAGDVVRLYARIGEGTMALLEPNGVEVLKTIEGRVAKKDDGWQIQAGGKLHTLKAAPGVDLAGLDGQTVTAQVTIGDADITLHHAAPATPATP